MVPASPLQMVFSSQNGSRAGVLIPPETPLLPPPLSSSSAPSWGVRGCGLEPKALVLLDPLPPWPSPSVLWPRCRAPSGNRLAVPGWRLRRTAGKPALGLGSRSQVCACSPLPPSPRQLRCPHTSSITPFPGCSSLFSPPLALAISNPFTPESARESESNLPPAGAAGVLGSLRTRGFSACRKATGHKQGALHPSWALHWFCWCLRKGGTRDKEHEGFGVWLEPGVGRKFPSVF